jgi:ATP-dependent RNA helicase RhlE
MEQQIRRLRGGVEIVVACPGRLLDHLWKGTLSLADLETLVIDEADRMFDMGFLPDTRNVLKCILHEHQTLLFSATIPTSIRSLVREIMHDPVTVQIDQTLPAKSVSHAIYPVEQHLKTALLKDILRKVKTESVLVFTRTKHRAERVAEQLVRSGYKVTSLQGNLPQSRRQAALDGFRNGSFKILVATDIAARGIDVLRISHVINYDMPENTDAYIHRIGRTGRVNNNGDALTFVTSADTAMVNSIEQVLKKKIERRTLENFDYAVPSPEKTATRQNSRFTPNRGTRNKVATIANVI